MSSDRRWMQAAQSGPCGCGNRIHAGDDVYLPGGARALCRSCAYEDGVPAPPSIHTTGRLTHPTLGVCTAADLHKANERSISTGPAFDPEWNGVGLPPSIATLTVRKPDGSVLTKKPDGWTVWEVPATPEERSALSPPHDLALARAIFRSDPRVVEFVAHRSEAFLPGHPVAPQPGASAMLERNMAKAWDRDEHGWKTEAEARAAAILAAWGVP